MSRKFDRQRDFEEDFDYGERLHREKTKKIKRGKSRYFDDIDMKAPRREKPARRSSY